jgi:hypothetical protein
MQNQRVSAHELTSFYVVNLLAGFSVEQRRSRCGEPLGTQLAQRAADSGRRAARWPSPGGRPVALHVGFFSDSFTRSLVDIDYYIHLGARAYRSLARHGDHTLGDVFDELSTSSRRSWMCSAR